MPTSPEPGRTVRLSVCYARPDTVFLESVAVPAGTTIMQAVQSSGLIATCPEVDPTTMRVGIFGKLKTIDTPVREGDRVEVYRALTADPKQARRKRVQKTRATATGIREGQKWLRGGAGD